MYPVNNAAVPRATEPISRIPVELKIAPVSEKVPADSPPIKKYPVPPLLHTRT
jgi:hypothetical protein